MHAHYTVRNESLNDITISMDKDSNKTYTIPPNGEAVFKSFVLERPDFRIFEASPKNGDDARLLAAKTVSPLASLAASAISVKYVFDGGKLH